MSITIEQFKESLKISYYISLAKKQQLINEIIATCFENKNGLTCINHFVKEMIYKLGILRYYTNFEFKDNIGYDDLEVIGAFKYVIDAINNNSSDLVLLNELLYCTIEESRGLNNSLSSIISKKADLLISSIPDKKDIKGILNSAIKTLSKTNPEVVSAFTKELFNGDLLSMIKSQRNKKNKIVKKNIHKADGTELTLNVLERN